MRPDFDRAGFARDVRSWLDEHRLSYRDAVNAHPILNPAMLSRACNQQPLNVASVLVICSIVGLQPSQYLVLPDQRNQTVTAIGKRETRAREG